MEKKEIRKKRAAVQDFTEGEPMGLILAFALPLLFGMLFQQLYSLVDTMIVGRYLGVNALAGVGSTASVNFMINGFAMGIGSGFAIPVAQRFGARDHKAMRKFAAQSIVLCTVLSVVLAVVVVALLRPLLTVMRTPSEIFDYAYSYILIVFIGIPATCFYNLFASLIRSTGNSRTPVVFLIVAALVNVVLDIAFILYFGMGVAGAGLATVISQLIAGIGCLIYIIKAVPLLHMTGEDFRPEARYIRILLAMGLPMGLQYSITAIGSVILQTAVNGLGALAVAAMTAGSRVSLIMCCVFEAIGSTMSIYSSQNTGAGRVDRLNEGIRDASLIGIIYAVAAFAVTIFFGERLCTLFVESSSTEVLALAHRYLVFNAAAYIGLLYINILRFMIQGMGYSGLAVLAGVMEMIARIVTAIILIPVLGFTGACLASPFAWVMADLFLFPAYFRVRARLLRRVNKTKVSLAHRADTVVQ